MVVPPSSLPRFMFSGLAAVALCVGCYSGPLDGGGDDEDGTSGSATQGDASDGSAGSGPSGSGPSGSGPSSSGSPTSDDATASTSDTGPPPVDEPLPDRILVTDIVVPAGVKEGVDNWRIWGRGSLHVAPVFTAPLAGCGTLVGYSTGTGASATARAELLGSDDQSSASLELGTGFELRGLAAEPDGNFAALLWNSSEQRIYLRRFDSAGAEQYSTELVNPDNTPTDFGIGESRLEYGNGSYGAYYHVHSDSGHEGDTLKWVTAASGAESTGWGWGCSHSMSNLLRFNAAVGDFLPVCVTDCFPGTSGDFGANSIGGIYLNHSDGKVMDVDAGCNGSVAGELGGAALGPAGWALVFNAHQAPATGGQSSYNPATMNQDIGFSTVSAGMTASGVVWLTDTPSEEEADSAIARWQPAGDDTLQYLVGWHEPGAGGYQLARIDEQGGWLEGPLDVSDQVQWGRRDDPFRADAGGDVVWAWFDDPGSTTMHFARVRAAAGC